MNEAFTLLTEPLQYPFMLRGMAAAVLVGFVCAVVGTFVVLRGMAFFANALSHGVLPGVAAGYLLGGGQRMPVFFWAMATAVFMALGTGAVSRRGRFKEDTTVGIVFAGMFALGIGIISTVRSYSADLVHLLFGDVLSVTGVDLLLTLGFGGAAVLAIVLFYKEFLLVSFDPTLAFTLRIPAALFHYALLVLVAVTTVVALQTVGVALVLALLVTPPATALLFTRHVHTMMALATLFGALAGVIGLYLSYYAGIASGPAIVLVSMSFFLGALAWSRLASFRSPAPSR